MLDNGVAQAAAGACPAAAIAVLGVGGRDDRMPLIVGHRRPAAQPAAGRGGGRVVFLVVRHHRCAAAVVRVKRQTERRRRRFFRGSTPLRAVNGINNAT